MNKGALSRELERVQTLIAPVARDAALAPEYEHSENLAEASEILGTIRTDRPTNNQVLVSRLEHVQKLLAPVAGDMELAVLDWDLTGAEPVFEYRSKLSEASKLLDTVLTRVRKEQPGGGPEQWCPGKSSPVPCRGISSQW